MTNKIFEFQFNNNNIYRSFCDLINKSPSDVTNSKQIPFLPIKFFKSHKVISSNKSIEKTFISSGTTKTNFSKHHITDLKIYESSFENSFKYFFGDIKKYTILALLPSYLENENSSLIYMINKLILKTNNKNSGFYLNNYDELKGKLISLKNEKVLLFGVTFALLNLVEKFKFQLPNLTVIETGGMKGRRKEIIREELHFIIKQGFGTDLVCSEYGMTELLSQAYSQKNGIFQCPPWMKIHIREPQDALSFKNNGLTGGVNIIDLANINSCSFIATDDLGRNKNESEFEIEELVVLYRKWCSHNKTTVSNLSNNQLIDLINHFFPNIEIDRDKYISGICNKLWDKHVDIQTSLDAMRETLRMNHYERNTTHRCMSPSSVNVSIYDTYNFYCKYHTHNGEPDTLKVSKVYFEKYIFDNMSEFITDNRFLSCEWYII